MADTVSVPEAIGTIDKAIKREFDANRRILSFDEFLSLVKDNPKKHTRGSAKYMADMMDSFGSYSSKDEQRFKLFDFPIDGLAPKIVNHSSVQLQIHRTLQTFIRQKINNKLILLHGPNGSAKSSIIHALMGGLEKYSSTDEGAQYTFNWVFPLERHTRGGMGLNIPPSSSFGSSSGSSSGKQLASYAKLPDEETAARVPCDMRDHPLLIFPKEHRLAFLEKLLGKDCDELPLYLTHGELCHRCKQIADALLIANGGDFKKVLMHIQVERLYLSRRYRRGLITIEPQLHVDAQYHQLTYNKSVASLPATLQSLNLFALTGDLVDGNRGAIEYSDLLKRPVDTFKYLLGACETGSVNVGSSIAYLDTIMLGSTNEIQLDAFKEFPDFSSFKARIGLIRVPYLLSVSDELEIYSSQLDQFSGDKHIAPHVAWSAALWTVLTRLKKPNTIFYPPSVSALISNLSPLEKARIYDTGEFPSTLSAEERKAMRANLQRLREEYTNIPYYEGRTGASAREIKSILYDAAQNPEFSCLSPLSIMREMEEFIKRVSEYDFLKQEIKDGYHDAQEFIHTVRNEYLNKIDHDVRDSMGIYNTSQWEDFLKKYVQQISLVLKKEKTKNSITGKMENPDHTLINEFEKIIGIDPQATYNNYEPSAVNETPEREAFRQNIISQVGVWSLNHPGEPVVYSKVFPDFWSKLEKHYFESQKHLLTKMHKALVADETEQANLHAEDIRLAKKTVDKMVSGMGYCEKCAKEVISFLVKQRY